MPEAKVKGVTSEGVPFELEVKGADEDELSRKVKRAMSGLLGEEVKPILVHDPIKKNPRRRKTVPIEQQCAGQILTAYRKGLLKDWKVRQLLKDRGYSDHVINSELGYPTVG